MLLHSREGLHTVFTSTVSWYFVCINASALSLQFVCSISSCLASLSKKLSVHKNNMKVGWLHIS